jgi:nucleoside-diphosphate-sugar epimerase
MKVLHVWNTAGVGSVITKYMDSFADMTKAKKLLGYEPKITLKEKD